MESLAQHARGAQAWRDVPVGVRAPRESLALPRAQLQTRQLPASPCVRGFRTLQDRDLGTDRWALTASAASSVTTPTTAWAGHVDALARAASRRARLNSLIELRALYRNFVRAKFLLRLPSPVYTPATQSITEDMDESVIKDLELEEQERRKEAVEIVSEMLLTAEQLKVGLRTLPSGLASILPAAPTSSSKSSSNNSSSSTGGSGALDVEQVVRDTARRYAMELRERLAMELPHLPFPTEAAAMMALDQRNARYLRSSLPNAAIQDSGSNPATPAIAASLAGLPTAASPQTGTSSPGAAMGSASGAGQGPAASSLLLPSAGQEAAQQLASGIEKLGQAEKVAEQFVAMRIKPALRKARETELVDLVKQTGAYLKGLWYRLNGGGTRVREPALSPDLPLPMSTRRDSELAISQLSLELDATEQRLREAARARDVQLRRARAPEGRATMPFQLKTMDAEVLRLSRALAIRTLQIELEYTFSALEDEAVDILGSDVNDLLSRQNSTTELRLLAAEFSYLDQQLAVLAAQLAGSPSPTSTSPSTPSAASGAAPAGQQQDPATSSQLVFDVGGVAVNMEDLLAALAAEVPDMRQRVGVPDQVVYGGQGLSLTKARLQVKEGLDKVREAVDFMTRGLRLLGSDIASAARLFGKAASGGTLKPREVSALRRTARDLLTFIPFTIILIIPLTPLGHVLVFGFIQTYFPSFFPSCFTNQRQDLMIRYEELERLLLAARMQAEATEEEAELARAAVAVMRLTSPADLQSSSPSAASTSSSTSATSPPSNSDPYSSSSSSSSFSMRDGISSGSHPQPDGSGREGSRPTHSRGSINGSVSSKSELLNPGQEPSSLGPASGSGQGRGLVEEGGLEGQAGCAGTMQADSQDEQMAASTGRGTQSRRSSSPTHSTQGDGQQGGAGAESGGPGTGSSAARGSSLRSGSGLNGWSNGMGLGMAAGDVGQRLALQALGSMDEMDEQLSQQAAQVRALEERVAAVLDDVTLGEEEEQGQEAVRAAIAAGKKRVPRMQA